MRHTVLVLRAVVALVLMFLFFSLALATSAGLLSGAFELAAFTLEHGRGRGASALLVENGFTPRSAPGEPVRFSRGDAEIEPLTLVRDYVRGELTFEEWSARWTETGLQHSLVAPEQEKVTRAGRAVMG